MKHDPPIKSYVPEHCFFDRKQQLGARICTEDCAVIDIGNDFEILAARGILRQSNNSLTALLGLTPQENRELRELVIRHRRFYWIKNGQPLLFFADWASETGLLLMVRPAVSPAALTAILRSNTKQEFVFVQPTEKQHVPHQEYSHAYDILIDLLSYTDVLFDRQEFDIAAQLSRIAAFAGCRLEPQMQAVGLREIKLSASRSRTVAFLYCAFLFLRAQNGIADANFPYRIALRTRGESEAPKNAVRPPFISLPCFEPFDLYVQDGSVILTLPTPKSTGVLAASVRQSRIVLSIEPILPQV